MKTLGRLKKKTVCFASMDILHFYLTFIAQCFLSLIAEEFKETGLDRSVSRCCCSTWFLMMVMIIIMVI